MRRPIQPDYATQFRTAAHEALFGHVLASADGSDVEVLARRLHQMFGARLEDSKDAIGETLRLVESNLERGWYVRFFRLPDTGFPAGPGDAERLDLRLDRGHVAGYLWQHIRGR